MTGLAQPFSQLLDPLPERHVRPIDAEPSKNSLDLPQTHTVIVQQDRQLDRPAIRPLTLEKLNLLQHLCQFGKVQFHQLH